MSINFFTALGAPGALSSPKFNMIQASHCWNSLHRASHRKKKKWNNIPFWNDLCAQNWLDKIIAHDTEKPKDKPIPEKFTAREKKSRPASSFPRSAFSTSISSSKRKSTGLQRLMLVINYLSYRIIFIDFFFSTDRLSPRICMLRGFIGCGVG